MGQGIPLINCTWVKVNLHDTTFFASSCFLNAENLFYYARHPLTSGKLLSVDEIRALLASVKESAEKQEPTLQVTIVREQSLEEADVNDLSDQNQLDNMATLINQSTNDETTESKAAQQNECQQELVSEKLPPATSTVQQNLATDVNTPNPIRQTEARIATEETDSGEKG